MIRTLYQATRTSVGGLIVSTCNRGRLLCTRHSPQTTLVLWEPTDNLGLVGFHSGKERFSHAEVSRPWVKPKGQFTVTGVETHMSTAKGCGHILSPSTGAEPTVYGKGMWVRPRKRSRGSGSSRSTGTERSMCQKDSCFSAGPERSKSST